MSFSKKPTTPKSENGGSLAACATKPCPQKAAVQSLDEIAAQVNPKKGTINCGNIIDSVIARLDGSNLAASAPYEQDGSFPDIEKRHNTSIQWGNSFDQAFKAVKEGGDGATAIIGIVYKSGGASHVVVMANHGGKVGIVEGQEHDAMLSEVITDPARAKALYGADSNVGIGMIPKKP